MTSMEELYIRAPINQWSVNQQSRKDEPVTIRPGDSPLEVFRTANVVDLVPGAYYEWGSIWINHHIVIHGNGATVKFVGKGPFLVINSHNEKGKSLIENVSLIGPRPVERDEPMDVIPRLVVGLIITDTWQTTVRNCNFSNFEGAAVFYQEGTQTPRTARTMQHLITECRFNDCRIAIAYSTGCENSCATSNIMSNCQIAFNACGGQWNLTGNLIQNCCCAYLCVDDNWYEGPITGIISQDNFSGNTVEYCGNSLWPTAYDTRAEQIALTGFFFDRVLSYPPNWSANNHRYAGMNIRSFSNDIKAFSITGCTFIGSVGVSTSSIVVNNPVKDKIHFIGCSGNTDMQLVNVTEANCTPNFGTVAAPLAAVP